MKDPIELKHELQAARKLALDYAGDYEYSEKDAEYEIQAVEEAE